MILSVVARDSALSKVQVQEVLAELHKLHPEIKPNIQFETCFLKTHGDLDLKTPLHLVENSDFFTREIDERQLNGSSRLAIHSAKDLPHPLRKGLIIACITKGVDPRDVLVLPNGHSPLQLRATARIGTSSKRRSDMIRALLPNALLVNIRGTIDRRLELLDSGQVDALIMAEAALIRLQQTHRTRIYLDGEVAPLQGQLAVVCCENDHEMLALFKPLDSRN